MAEGINEDELKAIADAPEEKPDEKPAKKTTKKSSKKDETVDEGTEATEGTEDNKKVEE